MITKTITLTLLLSVFASSTFAGGGLTRSRKKEVSAGVGMGMTGSGKITGAARVDIHNIFGAGEELGDRHPETKGGEINPSGSLTLSVDKDGKIQNLRAKVDVATIQRVQLATGFDGGPVTQAKLPPGTVNRLLALGSTYKQLETLAAHAGEKKQQNIEQARRENEKEEDKIRNSDHPHRDQELAIRAHYKQILQKEVEIPLQELKEKQEKLKRESIQTCPIEGYTSDQIKRCELRMLERKKSLGLNLVRLAREIKPFRQRKEEVELEMESEFLKKIPSMAQVIKDRRAALSKQRQKYKQTLAQIEKDHKKSLADSAKERAHIESEMKSLLADVDPHSPFANFRVYVDHPETLRPDPTAMTSQEYASTFMSTGFGIFGFRAGKNARLNGSHSFVRFSVVDVGAYAGVRSSAPLKFCFNLSPIGGIAGPVRPGVKSPLQSDPVSSGLSAEADFCVEKNLGEKIGILKNSLSGEIMLLKDNPESGESEQYLLTKITNRLEMKKILGSPVNAAYDATFEYNKYGYDGSEKDLSHMVTVGADL